MHKPIQLLVASCCATISFAQKTDTLVLHYKPDQFTISNAEKNRLDNFITGGWDRITINGFTDETEGEEYNLELSKKRAGEVYRYFVKKSLNTSSLFTNFFGESVQVDEYNSDAGRALNRRTVIIGLRYPRVKVKPPVDPMQSVTTTLDNGFIITYRPGSLPDYLADMFASGSGSMFRLVTNTTEMRQSNLYNNTTRGEILSSVLIVCNNGIEPCNLDSPVVVKVPIPFKTKCPIERVKFFNAVAERGKLIWQEESKDLYPETINGMQYIRVLMNNFCGCINFDFKIDPECWDTDSTRIQYLNANIKNLTTELRGLNSVYMPRKINDTTHSVIYIKDKRKDAAITFSLYNGKKHIRSFKDQPLASFPYDSIQDKYLLSTGRYKFHFPKQEVWEVVLKVNNDRYRVYSESNKYEFIYLNRNTENITVDFSIVESKKRISYYRNQSLASLPYDEKTGSYIIDKKFLKAQKAKGALAIR